MNVYILMAYDDDLRTGGADHARGVFPHMRDAVKAGNTLRRETGSFQHMYVAEPVDYGSGYLDLIPTMVWNELDQKWIDTLPDRIQRGG